MPRPLGFELAEQGADHTTRSRITNDGGMLRADDVRVRALDVRHLGERVRGELTVNVNSSTRYGTYGGAHVLEDEVRVESVVRT